MEPELIILLGTAAFIGFLHTLLGPDHYLPFIALAKTKGWSLRKTCLVTVLCGIGHVLGSIALGFIGIFLGIAVFKLESIESVRGDISAWLLLIFGFTYMTWGIWHIWRSKQHAHDHTHANGEKHSHAHSHKHAHVHVHEDAKKTVTPWVLFVIFVFGPCEALIPLIMYPASQGSVFSVIAATGVFAVVTILTMLGMVMLLYFATARMKYDWFGKYAHAVAGLIIFLCGCGIIFVGL